MPVAADKPILIFDGVCNFCDWSVRFVMNRDPGRQFLFASNQSAEGARLLKHFGVDPDSAQSVYLVEGGRIWSKSAATLEILRRMPFPWRLGYVGVIFPRFLRDAVYDWIAKNRYRWFGKAAACRIPTESEREQFLA
jgi:predicted DCC family thiol-disulfide oxidoreductase YuxK